MSAEESATPVDPIDALGTVGVIPVVVIDAASQAAPLAEALMSGGINGVEITLRTPAALAAIAVLAGYDGLLVGAGTLLEPQQAAHAADAGARFAVSPGFDPELLDACRAQTLPLLPGAATATEIQRVLRAGVRTCKFFPAESCGGLPALAALTAPFPEMRFVPTGGISSSNAARYLCLRSVHAVAGTWLAPRDLIAEGRWDLIRQRAAEAAQIVRDRGRPGLVSAEDNATQDGSQAAGLLTFGESMGLISTPDVGLIEFARLFRYGIGGAESNVAIGAARLGAPATWLGRLGTDATGDLIERRLRAEGVRVHAIRDGGWTGIMLRHRRFAGHVEIDYHRAGSAASLLRPADIPDELLSQARIVHVTGITAALSRSARDAVFDAVERTRDFGATVCFDVNYRSKLWDPAQAVPVLRALAARADILLASVDEARLILGSREDVPAGELARAAADLGPGEAVIKDGASGCAALIGGTLHEQAALSVSVLDPVGAGDAFAAGYLAEHLAGLAPECRLRTAVSAAAYAVAVPGDCEGLPRRHELRGLITDVHDTVR